MALTKPAGTWTYEDLLSLPDDGKRYEIIEGELYEMPAPSWDRDALHTRQTASGGDEAVSPLLGDAAFSLQEVFARLDENTTGPNSA